MRPATGRIRDEDLEEVRRRADLISVAGEYMQVKRAGARFRALCPFHTEKTPSFNLDPARNLYHCFGCGEGGDVIQLVRKLENTSFVETVELLARRVGVELRYEQLSPADRAAMNRRLRLVDAHRAAAEFYATTVMESEEAAAARTYLSGRGFSKAIVETFQVGFSPARRDACVKVLAAKGFSSAEIIEAGLGLRTDEGGLVDRFRGRVMFPIFDIAGDPVAFGARRMGDGDGPKYLNSPETPIYKKAHLLYGLNAAKSAIVRAGRALIVEGYTDVMALHQAGITEAVAACGTALGLDHLRTLQRFTQSVVLSLDADEAGARVADRLYSEMFDTAQDLGLAVRVVKMDAGTDPADAVRALGRDGFVALIESATLIWSFVLQRTHATRGGGDADNVARELASSLHLIHKIRNPVQRNEAVRLLGELIGVDANIIFVELEKLMRSGTVPRTTTDTLLKRAGAQVRVERDALKLAIQHGPEVKAHAEGIDESFFSVPAHREIWAALAAGLDPLTLEDSLDAGAQARRTFTELAVQPMVGEINDRLIAETFDRLKEFVVSREIEEVKARLQRLNPTAHPVEYEALFAELIKREAVRRLLRDRGNDT